MDPLAFTDSAFYQWFLLPLLIFLARITDVSLGTLRVMFVSRGYRGFAPVLGFFEVIIWLLAIGQIMQNLTNPLCYLAYALGFAVGTYVGIFLEGMISLGKVMVRVVTRKDAEELLTYLRRKRFGVTALDAEGKDGRVKVLFTVARRSDLPMLVEIIKRYNPAAVYTVEDVRFVSEAMMPPSRRRAWLGPLAGMLK